MRGESGRVAQRVRELLSSYGDAAVGRSEPGLRQTLCVPPELPGPVPPELPGPVPAVPRTPRPAELPGPVPAVPRTPRPALWERVMSRVPIRIDPGRRAAAAVGLAVLAAAVLTGVWVVAARPRAVSVSASAPQLPGATSPAGTEPAASGGAALSVTSAAPVASPSLVVVDVAGKVRRPGLYHLPAGARVDDAVRAAGGPLGRVDLSSLNLAAKVVDGEQILVGGGLGAAVAANPASAPGAGAVTGSGPVNLNSASLEQLEALPGIGPVLAQHVLEWRSAHGGFASVDQLNDVTGIGDVKFAGLRGLVTV